MDNAVLDYHKKTTALATAKATEAPYKITSARAGFNVSKGAMVVMYKVEGPEMPASHMPTDDDGWILEKRLDQNALNHYWARTMVRSRQTKPGWTKTTWLQSVEEKQRAERQAQDSSASDVAVSSSGLNTIQKKRRRRKSEEDEDEDYVPPAAKRAR
ncbi:hypothetical protein CGLO_02623 [Colletotrichum gloeosporioides Cg-14]|uniref:Uncharacterized protein n=1 Tax=Colletotrichum gloeosporioides (strain Cg-14) TaxID=1237896 RepID=T0KNG3_COLGC|nr:hypothetical protein CGLO_02623 [Colletotrichum gloeosporioides Cg-14]